MSLLGLFHKDIRIEKGKWKVSDLLDEGSMPIVAFVTKKHKRCWKGERLDHQCARKREVI